MVYSLFGRGISSSPIILAEVDVVADVAKNELVEMEAANSSQADRCDESLEKTVQLRRLSGSKRRSLASKQVCK